MYGAILGDIIGSRFEGRRRAIKTKDFELFEDRSHFTDDSVLTFAVAEVLLNIHSLQTNDMVIITTEFQRSLQNWGRKYLHAGYSRRFKNWILSENPQPYGGDTNGAAMRVSPVGWFFDSIEDTIDCAKFSASVSHNSEEGFNGAASVASAIFLARNGAPKTKIKNFIEQNFGYDLSRTLDEIRPEYYPKFLCSESVPEAIIAFLESKNFEDAVRNAISLGGDTDTQAAIAGSIAEAFYGIPRELKIECRKRLTGEMIQVLNRFTAEIFGENPQEFSNILKFADSVQVQSKTFEDLTPLKNLLELNSKNLPFKIERLLENARIFTGNITALAVDAIVNSVNTRLTGSTLSQMINETAGSELAEACRNLKSCNVAEAKITEGFNLPAKYVIHTVGPRYNEKVEDTLLLSLCYMRILNLARKNNLHSVAFPSISTGAKRFPPTLATYIAINSIGDWLNDYPNYDMKIIFVNLEENGTEIYKQQILKYISEN